MADYDHKDHTEETDIAVEVGQVPSGIPGSDQNGAYRDPSDIYADFYIMEGSSPGLSARIPPFWSRERDKFLRQTVSGCDGFLIAIYNLVTKIVSLVPTVAPLDPDDDEAVFAAKVSNEILRKAWIKEVLMALFDLLTQDNGMHIELLDGTRNSSKPLEPYEIAPGIYLPCIGLRHWDSQRVTRTGDETYPVKIEATNGKSYKIHHTRIISWTDLPSPKTEHYGIGLCAASRIMVNMLQMIESEEIVSDMLFDGMVGEIIFGQPFTSQQLQEAFKKAEQRSQDHSEPRYRRFVYVGARNVDPGQKFNVERIPLRRLPEGYNKADNVTLFMYLLAAALGIDAREIFPATVSGATRADADVQHRKSQNKFTRLWVKQMTAELEMKFAPLNTSINFEFTDAAEELEKAEARKALVEAIEIELRNGTITREVAAEQMHAAGYLTEAQLQIVLDFIPLRDQFGEIIPVGRFLNITSPSPVEGDQNV